MAGQPTTISARRHRCLRQDGARRSAAHQSAPQLSDQIFEEAVPAHLQPARSTREEHRRVATSGAKSLFGFANHGRQHEMKGRSVVPAGRYPKAPVVSFDN
jgi:hypothetical protein